MLVGPGISFGLRNDTSHLISSNSSATTHARACMSKGCVLGDINIKPNDLMKDEKVQLTQKAFGKDV